MVRIPATGEADVLPCRHGFPSESINAVKRVLRDLPVDNPQILHDAGVRPEEWEPLLRAAVESIRGTNSATTSDKKRFVGAVLSHCEQRGTIAGWRFIGSSRRQDYEVTMPDGSLVAVEAKGCPDGNNTNIWDRPSRAQEFVVWSLCPESLAHDPGKGVWSGIATRLLPKVAVERKVVDAFVFFDGRCGTSLRRCPKAFGVRGLRPAATELVGQRDKEDWLPPPCVYLFPRSAPTVPHNAEPPVHTVETCAFAAALLRAFDVEEQALPDYVHEARVEARGSVRGTEIQVSAVSRCWDHGEERVHTGRWKQVKREV